MQAIDLPNPWYILKHSAAIMLISIMLLCMGTGCKTLSNFITHVPSPDDVKLATSLVVLGTQDAVLIPPFGGATQELVLNTFILAVHDAAQGILANVSSGQAVMPSPADIQAFLLSKAAAFGSPGWMTNFIGNLVTEYTRFYNVISKDVPTATAYLNAFISGTV
jgi:hypothetical protein